MPREMKATGTTVSSPEPNSRQYWLNSRGVWLAWFVCVAGLHFLLLSMPFFSTPTVWTLTHVIHNMVRQGGGGNHCRG